MSFIVKVEFPVANEAIVLGRDGRELGTLDLQDVLEVIFGEVSL